MRKYECMYVLHPELSEEETNQFVERFQKLVVDQGGVVDKLDIWGKRRLAYEVNKIKEGYYVLFLFQGEPAVAQELERVFRITEKVVRYLVVRLDEKKIAIEEEAEEVAENVEETAEETVEEALEANKTEEVTE